MEPRLIDTNIFSYWFKAHSLMQRYDRLVAGRQLFLSFMSVAELLEGAKRDNWVTAKLQRLTDWLGRFIVVQSTPLTCEIWSEIRFHRREQRIGGSDAWIAASAIGCGVSLVTHNARDFAGIPGLQVITA